MSLVVLVPADRWWTAGREAALPPLVAGAVAALFAAIATAVLARRWARPIKRLGEQAERIAAGDFAACELPARNDEIRDLSLSLERMRSRLSQYESEVRRNERLRTLGQLGAGLAHQLRNWATGARMALDLHRRECGADRDDESLGVASRQLTFIESYLHRFLSLGRGGEGPRGPLELGALVDEVLSLVRPVCEHAKVELRRRDAGEPVWIEGDAEALRNALVNLALNAVEAARQSQADDGLVCLEVERRGGRASACIKDSGPGPAADVAKRVFEPFVSNKRDGAGLGLSMARQTIEEHGGEIAWRREDDCTVFAIDLPLMPTPLERALSPISIPEAV
jgi:signal transduction histidine kinase